MAESNSPRTRTPGTNRAGVDFPVSTQEKVWRKGEIIAGEDPAKWRRDAMGSRIRRDAYYEASIHGWEIDHVMPVSAGGSDNLTNLRPLQWENNRLKNETWPWPPLEKEPGSEQSRSHLKNGCAQNLEKI